MRERRSGLVVYMSSKLGRYLVPFMGLYAASKWAMEALAEPHSSYELAPFAIDIAIVEPAVYPTGLFAKDAGADDPVASHGQVAWYRDALNQALDRAMEGRDPAHIAHGILRLAKLPVGKRLRTAIPATPPMDEKQHGSGPHISINCCRPTGCRSSFPRASADAIPRPCPRLGRLVRSDGHPAVQPRRRTDQRRSAQSWTVSRPPRTTQKKAAMPAKGSAEWHGDVLTGTGAFHSSWHDQRGLHDSRTSLDPTSCHPGGD